MPAPDGRVGSFRRNGQKANVSVGWTAEISGVSSSHIVAFTLLMIATASSAGALLALLLVGLHLCPATFATDLFGGYSIAGLSSGLVSVLQGRRSPR